jgi:hypothetical protein
MPSHEKINIILYECKNIEIVGPVGQELVHFTFPPSFNVDRKRREKPE